RVCVARVALVVEALEYVQKDSGCNVGHYDDDDEEHDAGHGVKIRCGFVLRAIRIVTVRLTDWENTAGRVPVARRTSIGRAIVIVSWPGRRFPLFPGNAADANRCDALALSRAEPHTGDLPMKFPATFAGLFIAASAALIPASAATAAPLASPLALREAAAGPLVQVQYRYRYPRRPYRSYAYPYRGYGRGCVSGDDSTTSAYPSWAVCHRGRGR